MNITYFDNYQAMSEGAAGFLVDELARKSDLLLCSATGASPLGLYERLVIASKKDASHFAAMRVLKLDEWGGIPMRDPDSCHIYLHERVLNPLKIHASRYEAFDSEAPDLQAECDRVQRYIDQSGPIDVCVLGLGKNGHLGFNEPSDFLRAACHIAQLSTSTVQHSAVQAMSRIPTFGMTVGMQGILSSRKILLLVTGSGKQDAIRRLMTREITTQLPASLLWSHPHVECMIDSTSV